MLRGALTCAALVAASATFSAHATLLTDPSDPRSWQGATVSTFAGLFGLTNQQVIDQQLLDDGYFDPTGYTNGTMIRFNGVDVIANPGFGSYGTSFDQPDVSDGYDGTYSYGFAGAGAAFGGNAVDQHWIQTDQVTGHSIWDLGFQATKAAVFNTVDHGPLPGEAIESTVYLSNDKVNWTQAVTERVWLEGIYSDTSVIWDGFAYAVGTGTNATFRYAAVIRGGPGALLDDGDNEINAIMGLQGDFTGSTVPEPASLALLGFGLAGLARIRKRR